MKDLDKVNHKLKAGFVGVQVQQRGGHLYLVATLPPKPGVVKSKPYQQRISLGIQANPAGIKRAELEARRLGLQIVEGSFTWDLPQEEVTVGQAIDKFTSAYFLERGHNCKTDNTFHNYLQDCKRLGNPNQVLTPDLIIKALLTTTPNTRGRSSVVHSLSMLARYNGLEVDIKQYKGSYSAKSVNPRDLPTDLQIQQLVNKFTYDPYRWVYGMMATYGLRNHEVFFIEPDLLIADGICHVLEGKTISGKVWPLYPEWVERFDLKNIRLPKITGKTHSQYGERIARGFKRACIGFTPYALRHCWARRSIEMGLDSRLAAKQMRHSHSVHVKIYNAWLDDSVHQRAYDRIMSNPDRPQPPK